MLKLGTDIAVGLSLMHERGFVHGDLKANNIGVNLTGSMCAKLLDLAAVTQVMANGLDHVMVQSGDPGFIP